MLSARGILDSALELVHKLGLAPQDSLEVQLADFLLEATRQARIHSRTSAQHDVLVKLSTGIDVGFVDAVEYKLAHPGGIHVHKDRVEHSLGGLESFPTDLDLTSVRQGVLLNEDGGLQREALLQFEVVAYVAQLLLDHSDSLSRLEVST